MSCALLRRSGLVAILLASVLSACADITPPEQAALNGSSSRLVECPINTTKSTSGLIGPLGGTLLLDGHAVVIPAGAVPALTEFKLTVPASRFVEVQITAKGQEHFVFDAPIAGVISYARCTRSDIDNVPLSVWYIDGETKALLENMGGLDDKLTRTVTFSTGHLSSYAVAE